MFKLTTAKIVRAGIVGAIYSLLTFATMSFASGSIQLRVAEGLTLLPLIFPETAWGLFAGCVISNLLTGCVILDVVFGSLITFFSAILTAIIGKAIKNFALKIIVGGIFPVILNAILLPLIWFWAYGQIEEMYIIQVLYLFASQTISVYLIGTPIVISANKIINKKIKE